MAETQRIGIIGTGYSVPANIRDNDDPIFDWIKKHDPDGTKLFSGYEYRHVLSDGEEMPDIMVPACQRAIDDAGLAHKDIDMLLGYASVPEFSTPNTLVRIHNMLNLRNDAAVVAINNEFNNFNSSLLFADSLIRTGRARNILIVCGDNWTRHVDYHTSPCVSAGDGAGAAVIGLTDDTSTFRVVDVEAEIESQYYGCMYMQPDAVQAVPVGEKEPRTLYTQPLFHLTTAGIQEFTQYGMNVPPKVVARLLARNGVDPGEMAMTAHQTSSVLIDYWTKAIGPKQFFQTLTQYANMVHASIPVNLAYFKGKIEADWIVLLGIASEMQTNALLLRRNG